MINIHPPYSGTKLLAAQPDYDEQGNECGMIRPYHANRDLIKAVEYARLLQRPLLLRGEPGCGKTRLAQAVAYELYGADYRKYFFEWYVKSTSKAQEGLYAFDHLAQLRDIEANAPQPKATYLSFGEVGKAFQTDRPAVLLIDEIDKANIDFPNDLLLELDQHRFDIPELDEQGKDRVMIKAKHPPLVFITSNDERELPNAFLRRCIFHYIGLDDEKQRKLWIEIVQSHQQANIDEYKAQHFGSGLLHEPLSAPVIEKLVERFSRLVTNMRDSNADKIPDTSELLDWTKAVHYYWATSPASITVEEQLAGLSGEGPLQHMDVLLKTLNDYKQFRS